MAVDHGGPEAVKPFVAGTDFPTVIDGHGTLSRLLDFKVVPNGVLIDADGTVRWAKFGGFAVDNPDDLAVAAAWARGEEPGPSPDSDRAYELGALERELIQTKLRLGEVLVAGGRREEGVAAWRDALRLDPDNFTIRKQIWAAEHPEKFFPTIDFDWQTVQLAAERERERAEGWCGPDGCPLPWADGRDGG